MKPTFETKYSCVEYAGQDYSVVGFRDMLLQEVLKFRSSKNFQHFGQALLINEDNDDTILTRHYTSKTLIVHQ